MTTVLFWIEGYQESDSISIVLVTAVEVLFIIVIIKSPGYI